MVVHADELLRSYVDYLLENEDANDLFVGGKKNFSDWKNGIPVQRSYSRGHRVWQMIYRCACHRDSRAKFLSMHTNR
jgi:hypothetical protein